MRRYRFVEDALTIGHPETTSVIKQTRQHFKLWNRVDLHHASVQDIQRYREITARSEELMFDGLKAFLDAGLEKSCLECKPCAKDTEFAFGGVQLCDACRGVWGEWVEQFPERFRRVFPEVGDVG
jgi:Ni,Fe-hydrogenase I large subunit